MPGVRSKEGGGGAVFLTTGSQSGQVLPNMCIYVVLWSCLLFLQPSRHLRGKIKRLWTVLALTMVEYVFFLFLSEMLFFVGTS